ncbi:uncharacterized protein ACNLHF_007192 [Anomaloglossus baeobatrachus]
MPIKDFWCYHEAQKMALERLQKEWEPPAVPCATPMTTFLNKRIHLPLSNVYHPHVIHKHLKTEWIPQRRLCSKYNLQLNDLHVLMPRNLYQYGAQKANTGEKTWHNTLCASYPVRNIWGKKDYLKTPKVHDVLLKYGGPEVSMEEHSLFEKKTFSQKINPTCGVNAKKLDNFQTAFYIEMPQSKLRIGNLDPKRYQMRQKKKEPFIF